MANDKPTTRPENFDVQVLIDYLRGTCQSLAEGVAVCCEGMDADDLTDEDTQTIDENIFRCGECDWWCENDEMNEQCDDEGYCTDCRPNDNE